MSEVLELNDTEMLDVVRKAIVDVARSGDFNHITLETQLASLGLDSLATTEVVACLEDRLGMLVPDDRMIRAVSVGDMIAILRIHAAEQS
jgi:acyl carrier protein